MDILDEIFDCSVPTEPKNWERWLLGFFRCPSWGSPNNGTNDSEKISVSIGDVYWKEISSVFQCRSTHCVICMHYGYNSNFMKILLLQWIKTNIPFKITNHERFRSIPDWDKVISPHTTQKWCEKNSWTHNKSMSEMVSEIGRYLTSLPQ